MFVGSSEQPMNFFLDFNDHWSYLPSNPHVCDELIRNYYLKQGGNPYFKDCSETRTTPYYSFYDMYYLMDLGLYVKAKVYYPLSTTIILSNISSNSSTNVSMNSSSNSTNASTNSSNTSNTSLNWTTNITYSYYYAYYTPNATIT